MSARWEAAAAKYDEEKPRMQQQIRSAPSISQQASQAKSRVGSASYSDGGAHRRS